MRGVTSCVDVQQIEVTWEQLFLPATQTYNVYDVLAQKPIGTATGKFSAAGVSTVLFAPVDL